MELVLVDAACKPKVKREDQDKIKRNDTRTTLRKNNLQIRTRIIQLCFWQIFKIIDLCKNSCLCLKRYM